MSKRKKEDDRCISCPLFWSTIDYYGEPNEGCYIHCYGWFNDKYKFICFLPRFIRKWYVRLKFWLEYKDVDEELEEDEPEEDEKLDEDYWEFGNF